MFYWGRNSLESLRKHAVKKENKTLENNKNSKLERKIKDQELQLYKLIYTHFLTV